ncbi:hypothetical protein C3L33_21278, partial [Rhododendron williamsianum]
MPLTRVVADALGVLTICLVALLVLLGLFCILYSVYFRSHIRTPGFIQLSYFSRPWIIRIVFILFAICWGCGEIVRLNLLRQEGSKSNVLISKWQETVCKIYVVTNLGFAEPCLFLTLAFLVRASLLKTESAQCCSNWTSDLRSFFPLRVLLLGLTVLSRPEQLLFEALSFLAFLSLLCCVGVDICILVYFPVADSLALRKLHDIEARRRISDEQHIDTVSLIANQALWKKLRKALGEARSLLQTVVPFLFGLLWRGMNPRANLWNWAFSILVSLQQFLGRPDFLAGL